MFTFRCFSFSDQTYKMGKLVFKFYISKMTSLKLMTQHQSFNNITIRAPFSDKAIYTLIFLLFEGGLYQILQAQNNVV